MFMENRYDKYKDSGIAWIGEIPEHWEVIDLKYLSDIRGRIGFRGYTVSDLVSEGEGAFVIGGKHINQCVLNMESPDYISWDKYYESPEIMVSKGDIVMAQRGTLGKVAIIEYDINEATINPSLVLIKNIKCQGKFLYYYLNSESTLTLISILNTATAVPMISQNQIENMPIPIPSFVEQQSIANYLDQKCDEIDELITLQEGMITKLQSYKQSVITEAVTKGLDKNVPLKDSGIEWVGEIPKHWEVKRLKNVCSTNNASLSDRTSKEFEFDYVDIGSVSFELGIHKTEKYTFQNAPSRARKIARLGDIIVSTVRTYLRAIDIINSEEKEKYIYSTGFAILSPLKNILSEFMIYICRSEYFTNQVSIYSTGINYPSINDTALKMIYIVMPPLSEQQSIANYLDQKCSEIDELISIKQQKIEKLKDYKKSLIFECVTGKRKV